MRRQPWSTFYFSAQGRVPLSDYWLRFTIPVWACQLVCLLVGRIAALADDRPRLSTEFAAWLILIVTGWPTFVVSVKRLHDRNRSGWWLVGGLGPISASSFVHAVAVGGTAMVSAVLGALVFLAVVWLFVELCVLPGTAGDNRFGPDPRVPAASGDAAEPVIVRPPPEAPTAPDRTAWRARFK